MGVSRPSLLIESTDSMIAIFFLLRMHIRKIIHGGLGVLVDIIFIWARRMDQN